MSKLKIIFKCFGFIDGIKYIVFKMLGLSLRGLFILFGRRPNSFAIFLKRIAHVTDLMVQDYIYHKYIKIYDKYSGLKEETSVPTQKVIWTAWLQGTENLPFAVETSIKSFKNNSSDDYKVVVITLKNAQKYIDISDEIISLYENKDISAAHLTDYFRVKLLHKYGGIWLDATQFLIRPFPKDIWNEDLLLWNKIYDITGKNIYVSIPFVEKFNNGFLIAKENSLFYKFAEEITEKLLFDPILKIDYFSNFKAYFAALDNIPIFKGYWNNMRVINPYGMIARQYWNSPITPKLKEYINLSDNYFFVLTYKREWLTTVSGKETVQQYIVRKFGK